MRGVGAGSSEEVSSPTGTIRFESRMARGSRSPGSMASESGDKRAEVAKLLLQAQRMQWRTIDDKEQH